MSSPRIIAPGQPADIVLLRPVNDASRAAVRYVVNTILR